MSWEEAFPFYLWHIWLTRNNNLHNNAHIHVKYSTPNTLTIEYKHLTKNKIIYKTVSTFTKWKPPSKGYKLNTDGSTKINYNCSSIGGVIRNTKGDWILGFMGNSCQDDNITAEFYALRVILKLALE